MCEYLWSRGWRNFEKQDRESLDYLKQTVSRNLDLEDTASDGSEGNEVCVIGR